MDPETGTALTIEDYIWHPALLAWLVWNALNLHLLQRRPIIRLQNW